MSSQKNQRQIQNGSTPAVTSLVTGEVIGSVAVEPTESSAPDTKPTQTMQTVTEKPKPVARPATTRKPGQIKRVRRETTLNEDYYHRILQEFRAVPQVGDPLVVGVTSSVRGEGRSTVALGLASAVAQSIPQPVVLVETDLATAGLAAELGVENTGLSEYLRGELPLENLARLTGLADLWIIPAGDCQGQDLRTLRSEKLSKLFTHLRHEYAAVLVDLPPLALSAQSTRVISLVDRVLLVAESGTTPKGVIKSNLSAIPPEKQAGIILNKTRYHMPRWLKNVLGL